MNRTLPMAMGLPIITSESLTVSTTEQVRRGWRERLFSRPWQPWVSHKTVVHKEPDRNVYIIPAMAGGPSVLCHPVIAGKLRKALDEMGSTQEG